MKMPMSKRKRIFSLEPNENASASFSRRYVSYLVPALRNINTAKPTSENGGDDDHHQAEFEKKVKRQVDMALALSAQEFAWSRFLKHKLHNPSSLHDHSTSVTVSSSWNCRQEEVDGNELNKEMIKEREDDEEEEEIVDSRLSELKKILPGGEEMGVEEMLSEIGSYIVCLELQMTVLKSLVEEI